MTIWWRGLAPREKILIGIAAGLTGLIVLWQVITVPALSARAEARSAADAAAARLDRVQQAYILKRSQPSQAVQGTASAAALSGDALKAAITRSAQDKGIGISRLQGGRDGPIGVLVDQASPQIAFFWLEELETRFGATITRLSVEQSGTTTVRISADIEGRQ